MSRNVLFTRRSSIWIMLCVALLLAACADQPSERAQSSESIAPVTTTGPASPISTPETSASAAPPASNAATPEPAAPIQSPVAIDLAPFEPLRDPTIVDRLARNVRVLSDGSRAYRLAAWSPGSPWIAVTPQDGPGMDLIHSATGETLPVVTDTFVLEPQWTIEAGSGRACVVLHSVVGANDRIERVCPRGDRGADGLDRATLLEIAAPIRAPVVRDAWLGYSTDDRTVLATIDRSAPELVLNPALSIAIAADRTVALTPFSSELEAVQTLIVPRGGPPYALSTADEGWWLPRWSIDGSRLALSNIEGRIGAAARDGRARYDLGPGTDPAWSPDGSRIAFAGQGAGGDYTTRDIFVVDWQGHTPRLRLTDGSDEQFFASPTWSGDGARIAFVEIDSGQLFVADAP